MSLKEVFPFLIALRDNNNREWFAENKAEYDRTRAIFVDFVDRLIQEIALFDEEIKGVQSKDCIFRIYRDTRFSHDKTPYKSYYSAYIASAGGRKSTRGGYYIHVEPDDCAIAGGVWSPEPKVLKALRRSVYENVEEFGEIILEPTFASYFKEFSGEKLKTVPNGFPKDFPQGNWLKPKNYCIDTVVSNEILCEENAVKEVAKMMQLIYPLNRFLNFTIDEMS